MGGNLLSKPLSLWRAFFIKPDDYRRKIIGELSQPRSTGTLTYSDLLTLGQLDGNRGWTASGRSHLAAYRMELHTQAGVSVVVWGFRTVPDRDVWFCISAAEISLELESNREGCVVRSDGKELVRGGNVLDHTFELNIGERKLAVVAPKWRTTQNGGWQKINHIVIKESGKDLCRLILQPVRGKKQIVDYFSPDATPLTEQQLLALLSLSVVLAARFDDW